MKLAVVIDMISANMKTNFHKFCSVSLKDIRQFQLGARVVCSNAKYRYSQRFNRIKYNLIF